jgi:23S rRNA pseudouridine1911/1915/1917 synthase
VAKNDAAHQALSDQLAERTMGRTYLAWVCGEIDEAEGRVDAPIGRSKRNRTRMAVTGRHGRPAATNWRVVGRASGLTRIECRLESGRTHQIRVHMNFIGYPVAGDPEYGLSARDGRLCVAPGHPHIIQALSRLRRQMLHAYRIAFTHPTTDERMEFEAVPPEDFSAFDEAVLRGGGLQ